MNDNIETLNGTIERITFHNEENGFCVLKIASRGYTDLITVTGSLSHVVPGEYIQCKGYWVNDKNYGLQFKAQELNLTAPDSIQGIEKYLGSGLIKGIGPGFAKRLVNTFGEKVLDIIESNPKRLFEVPGIGEKRFACINQAWDAHKKVREIMLFLHQHGIGTSRATRIYKTYGNNAIEIIQKNPYRLAADIYGIGFTTADLLAERLGIPKDSLYRICAGIYHILQEQANRGHCAMQKDVLILSAQKLLQVHTEIIEFCLMDEINNKRLIEEIIDQQAFLFLYKYYLQEQTVAQLINKLQITPSTMEIDAPSALNWLKNKIQITLSKSQINAIKCALTNKISIITGGPGVGKTTVINCILQIVAKKTKHIILCAPTGRAAKRMSECCAREAKTLHRLLEFDPKTRDFHRNKHCPLDADLIIVDETSMLDISMMYSLLQAVPEHCNLILVGDIDQLPSVGPGSVLKDFIGANVIPTARLTEIFRQAAQSKIIINAHKINKGYMPILTFDKQEQTDFYFIEAETPEEIQQKLLKAVSIKIPLKFHFNPIQDIQVLTPMTRGLLGVNSLNAELQKLLNTSSTKHISKFGQHYSVGDKVIQTINNYNKEVFNGDIGFIKNIDLEESELIVEFDGRLIPYDITELDEISLAYAITIHKSQGSEYPVIVIPITMQHYIMLECNLLYTGITRGKDLVVLIGQKKAIATAVYNRRSSKRITNLRNRLIEYKEQNYA